MNCGTATGGTVSLAVRLLRAYGIGQTLKIVLGLVLLFVASGVALLQPWPLKLVLDSALGNRPLPIGLQHVADTLHSAVAPSSDGKVFLLVALCVAVVLIQLLAGVIEIASTYVLVLAGLRMVFRLRCAIFDHVQRLSLTFHDSTTVGDSLYRVVWDTYSLQALFNSGIVPALTSAFTIVAIVAVMFSQDAMLALLALAVGVPLAVLIRKLDRPMTERSLHVHERESDVTARVEETLSGIRTVQAFGREDHESARFQRYAAARLHANLVLTALQSGAQASVGLVFAITTAAAIWIGGSRVLNHRLTFGDLVLMVSYVTMLRAPLEKFVYTAAAVQSAAAGARRVLGVLSAQPDVCNRPGAITISERAKGRITLDRVTFQYRAGQQALDGITLEIAPGESVAIVGASGAGKSTLASLLIRFYDPLVGRIELDGRDIRDCTIASLRRNIALVLQEPVLFAATIQENIGYGRENASAEEIRGAAKAAGIHQFIESLPEGYHTEISERGVTLSGGQRQRISIARAFLKDAPVLVLDEPTSALDAETEERLMQALHDLMRGRTTIIISHRLSTIRMVDRILVLDNGRMVESGTHQELLAAGRSYAHLYCAQFGAELTGGRAGYR
jgi:ATP-binding cassette, subfamily B, bacterial